MDRWLEEWAQEAIELEEEKKAKPPLLSLPHPYWQGGVELSKSELFDLIFRSIAEYRAPAWIQSPRK